MKKSVLFRTALLMLVLTMVTSCFVGGTFAKYVTSGEGTDSARVAKFGVEITANGTTFAETYVTDDETADTTAIGTNSVISVGADKEDDDSVVAPGTQGNMHSMAITGAPEVAVEVKYEANLELGDNWVVNNSFYCPLEITVGEKTIKAIGCSAADEFERDVEDAIEDYTDQYPANTDLANAAVPSVSWAWPFSTSADNDIKDTALGDAAAGLNGGTAATISLTVKTTVTQID